MIPSIDSGIVTGEGRKPRRRASPMPLVSLATRARPPRVAHSEGRLIHRCATGFERKASGCPVHRSTIARSARPPMVNQR